MISRTHRRRSMLGQSFTTCLLVVVLFFGGIATYYFKVFQWGGLENPRDDLLIVKKDDSAELAFFRKKTVPDFVDPALQQHTALVALRKSTNGGTVIPEDYAQQSKQLANRLKDIMDASKLRQIPSQYEKRYFDVVDGISVTWRSLLDLDEAVASDLPADKERLIKSSIKRTKEGKKKLERAREYFLVQ